ncbi:MAG: (deoxy)nucleoside triphosphate pyrophosphohydrolase [Desulfovibrionales bacterium]
MWKRNGTPCLDSVLPEKQAMLHVVAGILLDQGKFLAVQRPAGKPLEGFWEFPGGKVEQGETLQDALFRELEEEIGIVPCSFLLWKEKQKRSSAGAIQLFFFLVPQFSGRPRPLEEQGMEWLSTKKALSLPFLEADLEIIHALSNLGM